MSIIAMKVIEKTIAIFAVKMMRGEAVWLSDGEECPLRELMLFLYSEP